MGPGSTDGTPGVSRTPVAAGGRGAGGCIVRGRPTSPRSGGAHTAFHNDAVTRWWCRVRWSASFRAVERDPAVTPRAYTYASRVLAVVCAVAVGLGVVFITTRGAAPLVPPADVSAAPPPGRPPPPRAPRPAGPRPPPPPTGGPRPPRRPPSRRRPPPPSSAWR